MRVSDPATSAASAKTATSARSRRVERRSISASRDTSLLVGIRRSTARSAVLGRDVPPQVVSEHKVRLPHPRVRLLQAGATQQEAGILSGPRASRPLARMRMRSWRRSSRASSIHLRSCRPRIEKRLVGDLDGRLAGRRLAVERQDPQPTERVQDPVDRRVLEVERVQRAPRDPPSRVRPALAERDQAQEDLTDRPPLVPAGAAAPPRPRSRTATPRCRRARGRSRASFGRRLAGRTARST